ncbi:ATP-dependent DNA ligase [Volvox carteri f. nagariensis]|uniref:DNA ligase n=1 Tax=Volvox carteri f. nagariensis TaxID=3068 RepID=D8U8W1_VOLCA|nr:ATP-dependent DNA ligase [Volvox carteri f. nagariensis]EFJ43817.1 ATP-dependent DNA ligase [Volvox carteri f. nagariensis]|eukprot:XP_002955063.1 ATP-dependent DNA ligase [Volvox carteri f. nagariensis]
MEGVGTGAVAAATKYAEADITKLITWKKGTPVPYSLLANTFEAIAGTSKRLEIVAHLVAAFRAVLDTNPPDLLPAVYLCVNRVAPSHTGIELGIGEATLIKALCEATGKNEAGIKKAYEASGDLGVVAVGARSTQRTMFTPPPLTIANVLKGFRDIAQVAGSKSVDIKRGMIVKMLVAAKGNEPGYIIRSLQAKLRIGLAEQSVLVALAHAVHLHREGVKDKDGRLAEKLEAAAQVVKQAYSECPSYDVLIPALLEQGTADLLSRCHFMPGVPVKPMLAKPTTGVGEVLEKFTDTEFTVEYKYDGERAQVHVMEGGKTVHIFSRNAENNTPKYPDIVARLRGLLKPHVQSIVFDSEAVAYDPEKKKILPFQVLSTRARKDVSVGEIKVQVVLFAFDCLYLNGESLLHKPLTERREALYGALMEKEGQLQFATAKTSRDVEELESFLTESVEAGTEGLIVKTLADTYEPSKRSSHWLKLKKDYMEGVGDTFDVVPLGAFYGKGKRTGFFGAYLLGVYDPDTETYQTISKLGTGFSEEQLQQLADSMRPHIIPQPRPYYKWSDALVPDVWFDAVAVWEVKAADLSISPVHKAAVGLVDPSKGISIRFPRLIRVREDKSPEDATSAAQVAEMFRSQAVIKQQQVGYGCLWV